MATRRTSALLLGWVFGAFPFAWLGGVATLAIRARFFLGYWPKPSRPDPKLLPFEAHHGILWIGLCLLPMVFSAGLTVYVMDALLLKKGFDRKPLVMFVGGSALILALIFSLYGDYNWVAWFLD